MKRLLSFILVVALLLAVVPMPMAAGTPKISMGTATVDVSSGNATVMVPVSIENNPGFGGMQLSFPIPEDWSILAKDGIKIRNGKEYSIFYEEVDGEMEKFVTPTTNAGNGSFVVAYGEGDITGDGILCWVTYTVPATAINGPMPLTVSIKKINTSENTAVNIKDGFTVTSGTITVTGGVDVLNSYNTMLEGLEDSYVYADGNAIEPSFAVLYGDKTLTKGTDYTVSYENNTSVGTATVTVTGTGSYKGSVSATFEIVKKTAVISGAASYTKAYGDAAFTLDAAVNSGAALSYVSDNNDVATVNASGVVTVVGAGSAVITVSSVETENYTKPVDFKVNVTVGKAGQTLTGADSYSKIYGDAAFNLNIGGAKGALSYSSSKPSVVSVDAAGKVTIAGVGTATITVTAADVTGKYNAATKNVTISVEQKEVSISGITVADKVYDKTTAATIDKSAAVINGKVQGDDLDISVVGAFADAKAGENKTVNLTVSLTGSAAANYKLATNSQKTAVATIEKETVAVPTAKTGLKYNTREQIGVEATVDYTVEGGTGTNVADYVATVTLKDPTNYKWEDSSFDGTVEWSIAKADAEKLTLEKTLRYSTVAVQTITAADIAKKLNAPGDVAITGCEFGGDAVLATKSYTADAIKYALASGLTSADAGKAVVITATISSDNYTDVTVTITVTVQDKVDVSDSIVFADGEATYTGKVQKHETAKYNGSANGITYTYSADPIDAGTYKVTATYEDADNYGTKTVDFRIDPAELTVTGGKVTTKKYDGKMEAAVESVTFSGMVNGEQLSAADYEVLTAVYTENANVGTGKKVSFTVELNDTAVASNYVLTGEIPVITGTIEAKQISISLGEIADQQFSGNAITPAVTVSSNDTVNGYALVNGKDYTVFYVEDHTNVGTATVVVEVKSGSNYVFDDAEVTFEITEAAAPTIGDMSAEYTYSYTGTEIFEIEGIPTNAGEVSYEIGTLSGETDMVSGISAANGKVSLTVAAMDASAVGKTVTIPVTVKMQNYADVEISIVITRIEKDRPVLAVQSIEKTYDGKELTAKDIAGTATFEGEELSGTWAWVTDPVTMVNANEEGYTATVKFTPDDIDVYMEVEAELTVVIKKADPVGKPSYTKINKPDSTLADLELGVGTITPEGTIAWVDSIDTVVEQGVKYQWIFTPADAINYNTLTGEIAPYHSVIYIPDSVKPDEEVEENILDKFVDVNEKDWYAKAVEMVVSAGLFEGVAADRFDPNGTMTRAMLVTVLWRLDGAVKTDSKTKFADVPANAWYADAVAWANENGIVNGIDAVTFAPNQNITREQMAVILYRYAEFVGLDVSARADLSKYVDANRISAYAVDAMSWAVANGLISGMTKTTLVSRGSATRAQVATILMRFVNNVL